MGDGVWGGSNGPKRMVVRIVDSQQSLLKAVLKKIIKAFLIRGKAQMKPALVVSQEVKNDTFFLVVPQRHSDRLGGS